MENKEFNLSDKREEYDVLQNPDKEFLDKDESRWINRYKEEDVKEFIKRLKEEDDIFDSMVFDGENYSPSYHAFKNNLIKKIIKLYNKRVDKLAGDKLI